MTDRQHTRAYETPMQKCPYCGNQCDADWCDIGVGNIQCGPYHCDKCGASEIGPHDNPRRLTKEEERHGWYGPHTEPGSSANVIGGKHVSHATMRETYEDTFTGNPLWNDDDYVDQWWKEIRQ